MRVLSRADVEAVLDLDRLVDALADAFVDVSEGRASLPPRIAAEVEEEDGILAAMPGYLPSSGTLATKLVSVFPRNAARGLHSHQAVIAVFDGGTGTPLALMDGTYITAVRTAAASALSVRLLAREDATTLAIIGTGVQARAHANAVTRVHAFDEIRVAGRDPSKADALADDLASTVAASVATRATFEDAIRDADVICATTHSADPVVHREWVASGAHVVSVGVNRDGPEVDAETVRDALVVVESRAAALAPFPAGAADLLLPIRDGVIDAGHIHAELGELVNGTRPGRTRPDQITFYKSVGIAAEDAATARLVLDAAEAAGRGTRVDL
jgi:alanine dehydrogenase